MIGHLNFFEIIFFLGIWMKKTIFIFFLSVILSAVNVFPKQLSLEPLDFTEFQKTMEEQGFQFFRTIEFSPLGDIHIHSISLKRHSTFKRGLLRLNWSLFEEYLVVFLEIAQSNVLQFYSQTRVLKTKAPAGRWHDVVSLDPDMPEAVKIPQVLTIF